MNFSEPLLAEYGAGGAAAACAQDLAKAQAAKKDNLILKAIAVATGHPEFDFAEFLPRLTRITRKDDPSETIALDGVPILQFWPPDVQQLREGEEFKLNVSQRYRMIKGPIPQPTWKN